MKCFLCNSVLISPLDKIRGYDDMCWQTIQEGFNQIAAGIETIPNGVNTIEGTEGMLRLTNGTRGDDFEDFMSTMMYFQNYPDAVILSAIELRGEWGADSNTPISRSVEKYVTEMLGLEDRHYNPMAFYIPNLSQTQKQSVKAIYDVTQKLLEAKQATNLILFRGIGWNNAQDQPNWANEDMQLGDHFIITGRTLSSWSFDLAIAQTYINRFHNGYVLKSNVPAKQIFAIIDVDQDQESVCIYNTQAEIVMIVKREVSP